MIPANDSRVMILLGMLTAILLVFIPKKKEDHQMKHTQTKFSLSHAITTIAISVAEKAVISGSTCIGLVYEPKVPEALKKEVEK